VFDLKPGQKIIWQHNGIEEMVTFLWYIEAAEDILPAQAQAAVRREDCSYAVAQLCDLKRLA
jgi:hypothetical protein